MSDPEFSINSLRVTASEVRELQARLAEAVRRRDWQILYLNDGGKGRTGRDLSIAADMTEGRVYQILRAGKEARDGEVSGVPVRGQWNEHGLISGTALHQDEDGFQLETL